AIAGITNRKYHIPRQLALYFSRPVVLAWHAQVARHDVCPRIERTLLVGGKHIASVSAEHRRQWERIRPGGNVVAATVNGSMPTGERLVGESNIRVARCVVVRVPGGGKIHL